MAQQLAPLAEREQNFDDSAKKCQKKVRFNDGLCKNHMGIKIADGAI